LSTALFFCHYFCRLWSRIFPALLLFVCMGVCPFPWIGMALGMDGEPGRDELYRLSLYQLAQVKVMTASRSTEPAVTAPSVVTIISREEIKRHGYSSLYQALARVPGFYLGHHNALELIGNRGFIQDQNTNYLLLIDGHAQLNPSLFGLQEQHIYPDLANVERIEIIRGPGSTLWGNSALMGVINIITRDPASFDQSDAALGTFEISSRFEFDDRQQSHNIQWGKANADGDGIVVSYTYFDSDADWYACYAPGETGLERDFHNARSWNRSWDFMPGHDAEMKAQWKGFRLLGRHASMNNARSTKSIPGNFATETDFQFLDLSYNETNISKRVTFRPRVFIDRGTWRERVGYDRENSSYYETLGAEFLLNGRLFEASHLLVGASYDHTRFDDGIFWTRGNRTDSNRAVFAEFQYADLPNWWLTIGGRYDGNSGRTDDTAFMPRFSLAHRLDSGWLIKYALNTGFVRPSMFQSVNQWDPGRGGQVVGAESGQTSIGHDLQCSLRGTGYSLSVDFFLLYIDDFITWVGSNVDIGATPYRLWNQNTGKVASKGVEIEAEWQVRRPVKIYGNVTYARARFNDLHQEASFGIPVDYTGAYWLTNDRYMANMPSFLWNLGADIDISEHLRLNLHYRGWADAWVKWTMSPNYERIGPGHYLDVNLAVLDMPVHGLRMDFFANLDLANADTPSGTYGGVTESFGQKYGFSLTYTF
jgi:outer membrane receptor for ferrienterochelin and colicin